MRSSESVELHVSLLVKIPVQEFARCNVFAGASANLASTVTKTKLASSTAVVRVSQFCWTYEDC
ncbi:hypothetical protein OESDEN_14123 [Oesophagostomum dentatum]|uniref:Uncharacterized protein n=1 Tax=Oesophagostomum dentatum TaxID=61180 RepID=A0A0B1SQK4_OESDE|nr:hypothetical protein OESDEN_14123 [Oesophagostomum dentatum]